MIGMTWLLTWLNVSIATLNATLQYLYTIRKGVRKIEGLPLEGGEGERTHEKQKGKKSRSCNCDFQRVFSLEGLDLGFKLELNLEDMGWWN